MTHKDDCQDAEIARAIIIATQAGEHSKSIDWKVNLILGGIGAVLVGLGGLVYWTVMRVDQIEARTRAAASDDARRVAVEAFREERKTLRGELDDDRRLSIRALLDEQAQRMGRQASR